MIYRLILFLIITSQVAYGQQSRLNVNKPFSFIDSLFTKSKYQVEFLDFVFANDVQEILLRFKKSLAQNKEWAEQYVSKNYKPGEGLPYHENFGITKEEYQKIKDIEKSPPSLVVKGQATIETIRSPDFLSFKAIDRNAKFFESLNIDLKNELLVFLNDTIPFSQKIDAPSSTPFGEWHGYSWKKEISNLKDEDDLKIDSLVNKIVEVSFGRVQTSSKILLILKYKEVNKGEIRANFDMSCYLN